jgi:membrane associated rhomboid family serine protease
MLEDRDYMRGSSYRSGLTLTQTMMIVWVVVFALQCINDVYLKTPAEQYLALTSESLSRGWAWQLITYQFLHADLMHLAGNLIGFWWVGRFCENVLGRKRFLIALFGCGIVGGLLQATLMLFFPDHFGSYVVGASAGSMGLLAIFGLLEKDSQVNLYFVLPVKGIVLLWIFGGVSLFFTIVPSQFRAGGMAHAAHLGGILAGIAWVKLGWHHDYVQLPWEGLGGKLGRLNPFRSRGSGKRELVATTAGRKSRQSGFPTEPVAEKPPGDFISQDVDPILEKISAHGIHSLTDKERKILEAARKKMSGR